MRGSRSASCLRPRPLPSTLVRVRTGLLQALSGHPGRVLLHDEPSACRAPLPIAYILGPAERASRARWPPPGGARAAGRPGPAPGAAGRAPVAAQGSLRRPAERIVAGSAPTCTRAHSLPFRGCRKPNVTDKCTPCSHPAGSPAPPRPGPPAQPRSLGFLPRSSARGLPPVRGGPARSSPAAPCPLLKPAHGRRGPENLASEVHKFKQGATDFGWGVSLLRKILKYWFTRGVKKGKAFPRLALSSLEVWGARHSASDPLTAFSS